MSNSCQASVVAETLSSGTSKPRWVAIPPSMNMQQILLYLLFTGQLAFIAISCSWLVAPWLAAMVLAAVAVAVLAIRWPMLAVGMVFLCRCAI